MKINKKKLKKLFIGFGLIGIFAFYLCISETPDLCGNGVCDLEETNVNCSVDCVVSDPLAVCPVISSIGISNVSGTSADITVSVSDSSGLNSFEFGTIDITEIQTASSTSGISGISGTFVQTINHLRGPGGTLYPYARICDTEANCTKIFFKKAASTLFFTEVRTDNNLDEVTIYALTSGTVPLPGTSGGVLVLNGTWVAGDLATATNNTMHYTFPCTANAPYTVFWDDDAAADGSGVYLGQVSVGIYKSNGEIFLDHYFNGGGYSPGKTFTNADYTGNCVVAVFMIMDDAGNDFAIRVTP